jgi:hypothetical protein
MKKEDRGKDKFDKNQIERGEELFLSMQPFLGVEGLIGCCLVILKYYPDSIEKVLSDYEDELREGYKKSKRNYEKVVKFAEALKEIRLTGKLH